MAEQVTFRLIGASRLDRLLAEVDGDPALAHALFTWNVRAAGAAMEAIHIFELVLRNALDRELRVWSARMNDDPRWLLNPHEYLQRSLYGPELDKARSRARRIAVEKGRAMSHDDVLAQLPLGFWRYLLPSRSNKSKQKLWAVALADAFPAWVGAWDPESLVGRVTTAHQLRNRVAHLEPLHQFDLRRARRDMRSVCHAVGPDAARLFVQNERLLSVIETNPVVRGD
ncbi:hypothetical protein [Protaetiibacter mangrovi]|uniref:Abi family protein n=1 Tax=Protaetiibacter mangrovi TaxID=2970926 RepID=A0ABT1ZCR8_9MICO|nr:hypothetical protein [Protaetiibacter mangrovi]MCS0498487.1 hypothetical protein [Protaetiibacter mangrovi]TPW99465.1 hypothetical protein FJ656_33080 [Schumannella luteola]